MDQVNEEVIKISNFLGAVMEEVKVNQVFRKRLIESLTVNVYIDLDDFKKDLNKDLAKDEKLNIYKEYSKGKRYYVEWLSRLSLNTLKNIITEEKFYFNKRYLQCINTEPLIKLIVDMTSLRVSQKPSKYARYS